MSLDGTTARRADDQWRSVDDVFVPSRKPVHNVRASLMPYVRPVRRVVCTRLKS